MRAAVCMIAYRRPEGLRRALGALAAQVFDEAAPAVRIVVVDNDDARSGEGCSGCGAGRGRGGSTTRWGRRAAYRSHGNAAFRSPAPGADWIAFADDDEEPAPGGLPLLVTGTSLVVSTYGMLEFATRLATDRFHLLPPLGSRSREAMDTVR